MSGIGSTNALTLPPPTSIPVGAQLDVGTGSSVAARVGGLSASKTTVGLTTVISLAVPGVLEYAGLSASTALTASEFKITINGTVVYDRTGTISLNGGFTPVGVFTAQAGNGVSLAIQPFNTLLIEYASDGTNTAFATYRYYLT